MTRKYPLNKLGLIMLGTTDLDASIAFYRDRLGMEIASRSEDFVFLKTAGVTLALSKDLTRSLGTKPGPVEVVFSVEHVREAYEELRAHHVEFSREPRVVTGSMWAVDFRDPDGHTLSIFGPE